MATQLKSASDHLYQACDILNDLLAEDTPYSDDLFDVMDMLASCVAKLTTIESTINTDPSNQQNTTQDITLPNKKPSIQQEYDENQTTSSTQQHFAQNDTLSEQSGGIMFGITGINFLHDTSTVHSENNHEMNQNSMVVVDDAQQPPSSSIQPSDLISCGSSFHSIYQKQTNDHECGDCQSHLSEDSHHSQYVDSFYHNMSVHSTYTDYQDDDLDSSHMNDDNDHELTPKSQPKDQIEESINQLEDLNTKMNSLNITTSSTKKIINDDSDEEDEIILKPRGGQKQNNQPTQEKKSTTTKSSSKPTPVTPIPSKSTETQKKRIIIEDSETEDDDEDDENDGEQAEVGVSSEDDLNNREFSSEGDDIDSYDEDDDEDDYDDEDEEDESFVGTTSEEEPYSEDGGESEEEILQKPKKTSKQPEKESKQVKPTNKKLIEKEQQPEKQSKKSVVKNQPEKEVVVPKQPIKSQRITLANDFEDDKSLESVDSFDHFGGEKMGGNKIDSKQTENRHTEALRPSLGGSKTLLTPSRPSGTVKLKPSTTTKPTTTSTTTTTQKTTTTGAPLSRFLTPSHTTTSKISLTSNNTSSLSNWDTNFKKSSKFSLDFSDDDDSNTVPDSNSLDDFLAVPENNLIPKKGKSTGKIPKETITLESDEDDTVIIARPSGGKGISSGKTGKVDKKEVSKASKPSKTSHFIRDSQSEEDLDNDEDYDPEEELSDSAFYDLTGDQDGGDDPGSFATPTKKSSKTKQQLNPTKFSGSKLIPDLTGKEFAAKREELSKIIYTNANKKVFDGQLPPELPIIWSKTLLKTAGRFNYKKLTGKSAQATLSPTKLYKDLNIELSTKVLDNSERLLTTLLHEICHLAALWIDNVSNPPHGKTFYKYAQMVSKTYPYVKITTYHSYDIFYKFQYRCTGCGKEFGRHSKVKELEKICCRYCSSPFEFAGSFNPDGTPSKQRQTSQYTRFQQQYSKEIALNWNKSGANKGGKDKTQLLSAVAQEYKVYLQDPEAYFPGISFLQ